MIRIRDLPRALVHGLLLRPFARWFIGFNRAGKENLPARGPVVLASNHNSHLDTVLILSSLPLGLALRVRPVAAEDYFGRGGWLGRLAHAAFHLVLVPRTRITREANPVERMAEVLRAGDSLLVYPEGSRGEPDRLSSFRPGVGHLASRFPDVPLIPACVVGSGRALPRGSSLPLPLWTEVAFGPPVRPGERPAETAAQLERVVAAMIEEALGRCATLAVKAAEERVPPPARMSVVGIDGSGKSTCFRELVRRLSSGCTAVGIGDTLLLGRGDAVEELDWVPGAFVKTALHRLAKGARRMSLYKVAKLAELATRGGIEEVLILKFRPRAALSDGHPLVNILAWGVLTHPQHFSESSCGEALGLLLGEARLSWRRALFFARAIPEFLALLVVARFRRPDAVVFLRLDPREAVRRIAARGEARQMHETEEKLSGLQQAYAAVLGMLQPRGVRVKVIDVGGKSAGEVADEAQAFVQEVLRP